MMGSEPHPIGLVPDVMDVVGFVKAEVLEELPPPWPRCQDLPDGSFGKPGKDDVVCAVSHCWPYAGHPDPMGMKQGPLVTLVDEAYQKLKPQSKMLVFLDFMSVSQRPYQSGQQDRTPEQQEAFSKALRAFPQIYLQADAVIHLDTQMKPVPGDRQLYQCTVGDLRGCEVKKLRESLVVVKTEDSDGVVQLFDIVESVDGIEVTTEEEYEQAKNKLMKTDSVKPSWSIMEVCTGCSEAHVRMRRCPFGFYSELRAHQKGWVYLERFASMVKGAMVPEEQMSSVAFATSEGILQEIFDGATRLRNAAKQGKETLIDALEYFVKELDRKHFFAVSLDKANNTGGVGGVAAGAGDAEKPKQAPKMKSADAEIVSFLMRELVDHLAEQWEERQFAQRQRALTLAVNRGDIKASMQLIQEGADVNIADGQGITCVHCAARSRNLDMVRLMVESSGDLLKQDMLGNCPAHMVVLFATDATPKVFEALSPTEEVLELQNSAGVTPYRRFCIWAKTAMDNQPYPPAAELMARLSRKFPYLSQKNTSSQQSFLVRALSFEQNKIEITAGGKKLQVQVWTPGPSDGEAVRDIVWAGCPVFLPPQLEADTIDVIAGAVCQRMKARIFFCDYYHADSKEETIDGFANALQLAIEALPLKKSFIFVDNSLGMGVHVLWRMQDRISAALVMNPHGWFSEEYFGSEAYNEVVPKIGMVGAKFQSRNVEGCKNMVSNWVFSENGSELEMAKKMLGAAMAGAPDHYWDISANAVKVNLLNGTPTYQKLRTLRCMGERVTLACSSLAPAARVLDTVARLKTVAPSAKIVYISDSKQWWELEGHETLMFVAGLVMDTVRAAITAEGGNPDEYVERPTRRASRAVKGPEELEHSSV